MKNKKILYNNSIQKRHLKTSLNKRLSTKFENIIKNIILNLDKSNNIFHSFSKNFKYNFNFTEINRFKKFKNIVVIGMGGSVLGSEAIYYFLKDKIKKKFVFLNNIDKKTLKKLKDKKISNKTLFIVISKSGNTVETISNFISLNIIKKKAKNIIIISEGKKNSLHQLAQKMQLQHIEHKTYMGGRYSVLSETGILPAYLMGINIKKLKKNLLSHLNNKNSNFLKDSSIKLANLLQRKKFQSIIFLNYIPQLEKFLYWNQQLMAESLGKNGKGFLPLISNAPKDHHSLLQLYLDGPRDKLFYIFSQTKEKEKKINFKYIDKSINFLKNKNLYEIKNAQKTALVNTLRKKNIPFREIKIQECCEESLGELFSYFMLETVIIGILSGINPFDQPAVEQFKFTTKKLLI